MTANEEKKVRPLQTLEQVAKEENLELSSLEFATKMDSKDPLASFRDKFHIPKIRSQPPNEEKKDCFYFCGNSLGLQPKSTRQLLQEELDVWANVGVEGHFDHAYGRPWVTIDETVKGFSATLVGAKESEVAIMNTLTVNLHFLMVHFYRPTEKRFKILFEDKAFPSDHYAIESQIKFHGYDPKEGMILMKPRENEFTLRTEDIVKTIEEHGDSIALVMFSGVQYYTGQFFDIKTITEAGHKKGCVVGFDLAHAVGNVELKLHDWQVDFACWCSYKYMNSGPGGIAGAFVHENHAHEEDLPRFAGWWGHDKTSRFIMENRFIPIAGAAGYQVSNPGVLSTVSLLSSLQIFNEASLPSLRAKSRLLTAYFEYLLDKEICSKEGSLMRIITPKDPESRGCQLSLLFDVPVGPIHSALEKNGVIVDKREPNVLRAAPTPLYNRFQDVHNFVTILKKVLDAPK